MSALKKQLKTNTCENTCISEHINITKGKLTFRPLEITTKIHNFFPNLLKRNLTQQQNKKKQWKTWHRKTLLI